MLFKSGLFEYSRPNTVDNAFRLICIGAGTAAVFEANLNDMSKLIAFDDPADIGDIYADAHIGMTPVTKAAAANANGGSYGRIRAVAKGVALNDFKVAIPFGLGNLRGA